LSVGFRPLVAIAGRSEGVGPPVCAENGLGSVVFSVVVVDVQGKGLGKEASNEGSLVSADVLDSWPKLPKVGAGCFSAVVVAAAVDVAVCPNRLKPGMDLSAAVGITWGVWPNPPNVGAGLSIAGAVVVVVNGAGGIKLANVLSVVVD
jgi:hypothetical protein